MGKRADTMVLGRLTSMQGLRSNVCQSQVLVARGQSEWCISVGVRHLQRAWDLKKFGLTTGNWRQ